MANKSKDKAEHCGILLYFLCFCRSLAISILDERWSKDREREDDEGTKRTNKCPFARIHQLGQNSRSLKIII